MRLTRPLAYLAGFAVLTGVLIFAAPDVKDLADARYAKRYEVRKAKELASTLNFCDGVYAENSAPLPAAIEQQIPPNEHAILSAFYSCANSDEREYLAFVLLGEGVNPFALRLLTESELKRGGRVWRCGTAMLQSEAAIENWLHHHAEAGAVFAMRSLKLLSNPEPVPGSLSGRG
jgi:hypothetical protein